MKVPEPDEEQPLAWMAIVGNTAVHSVDGEEVGAVGEVLGSQSEDIFHGLVIRGGDQREVMIPADEVTNITNKRIETGLTTKEISELPVYSEEESYKLGFVGHLRRRLGWVPDKESGPR